MSNTTPLPKFRAKKYHRRSFWACDECKLRKKKCDGGQPCATCSLHGKGNKDCTYDSKTRPSQPPTHRIRELENDIRSVRTLLSSVRGALTGNALVEVESMLTKLRPATEEPSQLSSPTATDKSAVEGLQSMLSGRDRTLRYGYRHLHHGPYSGPAVILSVIEFFQPRQGETIVPEIIEMFDAGFPVSSQSTQATFDHGLDLSAKSDAFEILNVVLMQSHPFLQSLDASFLHSLFENTYDAAARHPTSINNASLSLCHMVLALGNLMSVAHHRRYGCDRAQSKAKSHFEHGCKLIELSTNCDDITQLQTLLCASAFLIFMSRLSSAYTYLNLATVSAVKQGLLVGEDVASISSHHHGPIGDRTIAVLINIHAYLSTVLGLPSAIRTKDAVPSPEENGLEPSNPLHRFRPVLTTQSSTPQSLNILRRNFDIVSLTASVLRNFAGSTTHQNEEPTQGIGIDESILRHAERSLLSLSKDLEIPLSPLASGTAHVAPDPGAAKCEAEFTLFWSQLMIHIPFLNYLRPLADGHPIPEAASRPALTCLKLAVTVITRCDYLLQSLTDSDVYSQFMHPSNWTCIYTLFLAVLSLIFLISIHEGTSKPSEAWRKADTGIRILAALRCGDGGATRCLAVIKKLVYKLNYTVDFDFERIDKTTRRVCESQTKLPTLSNILDSPLSHRRWMSGDNSDSEFYRRTVIEKGPLSMSSADKMLAHAQSLLLKSELSHSEPAGAG